MRLVQAAIVGLALFAVATDAKKRRKKKKKNRHGVNKKIVSNYDLANFQAFVDGIDYTGEAIDPAERQLDERGYWSTFRSLSMGGIIAAGGPVFCHDLFGHNYKNKPTRKTTGSSYPSMINSYNLCMELKEIMTVRREDCKKFFVDVVYTTKWNTASTHLKNRKRYCSAITHVPDPSKPCPVCGRRNRTCKRNNVACIAAREARGLPPHTEVSMIDDLNCKPLDEPMYDLEGAQAAHDLLVQAAKEKHEKQTFVTCRGSKRELKRCNTVKKQIQEAYEKLRDTVIVGPEELPYCDPTMYAPSKVASKKNKPRDGAKKKNKRTKNKKKSKGKKKKKRRPGSGGVFTNFREATGPRE